MRRARLLMAICAVLVGNACRGHHAKPPADEAAAPPAACETNQDCPERWVCLAKKCANPSEAALYTDPSNAVTPTKVKQEVQGTVDSHYAKPIDDKSLLKGESL